MSAIDQRAGLLAGETTMQDLSAPILESVLIPPSPSSRPPSTLLVSEAPPEQPTVTDDDSVSSLTNDPGSDSTRELSPPPSEEMIRDNSSKQSPDDIDNLAMAAKADIAVIEKEHVNELGIKTLPDDPDQVRGRDRHFHRDGEEDLPIQPKSRQASSTGKSASHNNRSSSIRTLSQAPSTATTSSPTPALRKKPPPAAPNTRPSSPPPPEPGCNHVLSRYTLYETKNRFYITASSNERHKILKIERPSGSGSEDLTVIQDQASYDHKQLETLLRMVDDGNKSMGGLEKVLDFHGIIGFVRFTSGFYMTLCTKRSVVGLLGGHYIFHCDETIMLPISAKMEKTHEETRLLNMFQGVDLSKNFYFSYSYDLTNTLQVNLTRRAPTPVHNTHFMWNFHLLQRAFGLSEGLAAEDLSDRREMKVEETEDGEEEENRFSNWVLPLIHGFVDQAKIPIFGRTIYTTLIARRSRQHAGTRYLKRGVNENGYVANEVETEQIVSEPLGTSFHIGSRPGRGRYANYTSFVQVRGSIPLLWTQDTTNLSPRPPIEINVVDPFYSAAAKHFSNLLTRYGAPIVVVNLIKGKEPVPRESKLLDAYQECITYLNQFLPDDESKRIRYIAWDMAQATKSKTQDVIGIIEDIAEEAIQLTKFFHGGAVRNEAGADDDDDADGACEMQLQTGVLRTNCIDCLDRTNAFQFATSKVAFSHQVHALGIISTPDLSFDSDAIDMLIELWSDHGDTIAFQYTGSALVNRVETYRRTKTRQWSSHSRDLLENVKRYYNNSLLDADKQAAMDLFLGVNQVENRERPPDRLHYHHWYDPCALEVGKPCSESTPDGGHPVETEAVGVDHDIWADYYKPHLLSQFQRLYTFTMNSTGKSAIRTTHGQFLSPFQSRIQAKNAIKRSKNVVKTPQTTGLSAAKEREPQGARSLVHPSGEDKSSDGLEGPLVNLVADLLNPTVSDAKKAEYEWYTLYQTNELLSSTNTVEPQDLQLYAQAADIAQGHTNLFNPSQAYLSDSNPNTGAICGIPQSWNGPITNVQEWQMPIHGGISEVATGAGAGSGSGWPASMTTATTNRDRDRDRDWERDRVKPSDLKIYEAYLYGTQGGGDKPLLLV